MKTKTFCDSEVSLLGMGNMRLPTSEDGKIDFERAAAIIDRLYNNGVNYYDTAYVYHGGESEGFVGAALKKYPRESFYVATKYNCRANPDFKAVFEEQLKRLDMDYIDYYLLHAIGDSTVDTYLTNGCVEFFREQKRLGKIRHLGFSFHASLETMRKMLDFGGWDFAQIQLNYLDWLFYDAKAQYDMLTEAGLPVIVMEPVRGGRLAKLTDETEAQLLAAHPDWSIPSWAFRFLMRLDNVKLILSGMSTLDQADDNIKTFNDAEPLGDEDAELLFKACKEFKKQISAPCTGCRYCVEGCPMEIDIPVMMDIYNKFKLNGKFAARAINDHEHSAKDCIACGACSVQCPQSIDIPTLMDELRTAAES
ncbi:MAG: aldo/keto reductase [Clostridia bacterium]|nr:aldo/keto reductase [Clostridia bacterium]